MGIIKVMIADDHQLFRTGMAAVLKEIKGITVVNEAANGKELLALVSKGQQILKDCWLNHIGHQRPGMAKGLSVKEAKKEYREISKEIRKLLSKK